MKLTLLLLCFLIGVNSQAQDNNSLTDTAIVLDCDTDDCASFFENLDLYSDLTSIHISNYHEDKLSKDIGKLSKLEFITIENSPELKVSKLFNILKNNESLTSLSLKDNSLEDLPKNIRLLTGLKSINISNNDDLNSEKVIEYLKELENLEMLYLPLNSITDLPQNIGDLTALKVLDISNNYLDDIPYSVAKLKGLEEINLEGNIITNPASILDKAKNLNLKIISIDNDLSEEEQQKLKELFPNSVIKEVDPEAVDEEEIVDEEPILPVAKDTSLVVITDTTSTIITPATNEIIHGELKLQTEKLFLYSQAYMHYPDIFKVKNALSFDSTMFDERFLDSTYANTSKVQRDFFRTNQYNFGHISLNFNKDGVKNEIWFDINHDKEYNPEFDAFARMSWVYVGELSKKEFKKKYLKSIDHKWYHIFARKHWKYFTDFRVVYNSEAQTFELTLKGFEGFETITAYPRFESLNKTIADAQETYVKQFSTYSKALNRRQSRFERHLRSDKKRYERTISKNESSKWIAFQKNYMSEDEKKLTKEEWLVYYDKVIANEKMAMGNAKASLSNIERSLVLDGYAENFENQILLSIESSAPFDSTRLCTIKALFQKEDNSNVAVTSVLIINKELKTFASYRGSLGINVISMLLKQNSNTTILAELRNGDVGFVKEGEFKKIKFDNSFKHKFILTTVSANIATVQMIRMELGL